MKDLPKVPTWQLELDSSLWPSWRKAPNFPLSHPAPHVCACVTFSFDRWPLPFRSSVRYTLRSTCAETRAFAINRPICPAFSIQSPYTYVSYRSIDSWRTDGGGRGASRPVQHSQGSDIWADKKEKKRSKNWKEHQEREKERQYELLTVRPIAFMVLPFISICNNSPFTYSLNFKSNGLQ